MASVLIPSQKYSNNHTDKLQSRLVCIKGALAKNFHFALRHDKLVMLKSVASRIMPIWDTLCKPYDRIIFLFSLNECKAYCGLAEMAGPWKPCETLPDEWEEEFKQSHAAGGYG
jgi:hypothetical protein